MRPVRPAAPPCLNEDGALRADGIGETFRNLAESLMHRTYVMCGARIQAVMTCGMDSGLMRLRIHSSSGERLGGKRSEMK